MWLGQPFKTTDIVHKAITLFRNGPDGVTGNDDLGTMSAWHVLSALGIYPIVPGTEQWGLSTPIFPRADIQLDPYYYAGQSSFTITAQNFAGAGATGASNEYISSVKLGGVDHQKTYFRTADIRAGKDLEVIFNGTQGNVWGTAASSFPPNLLTGVAQ